MLGKPNQLQAPAAHARQLLTLARASGGAVGALKVADLAGVDVDLPMRLAV
jgi:hypothetical protein